MKARLKALLKLMKVNFKTLVLFQVVYRILGIAIIFPLASTLFYTSIRLSGYRYITNQVFFDYLFKPTTIIFLILLVALVSIYILIEMIFLSVLYHFSFHQETLDLRSLIRIALPKTGRLFKRYHILITVPALLFIAVIEMFYLLGIASTVSLPQFVINELNARPLYRFIVGGVGLAVFIAFIETMFTLPLFTLEKRSFRSAYKEARKLLKGDRMRIVFEFIVLNAFVNIIIYAAYGLVFIVVAGFIFIAQGQAVVLGVLLTVVYLLYAVFTLVATAVLIPINLAWMKSWYYTQKESHALQLMRPAVEKSRMKLNLSSRTFKLTVLIGSVVLAALNITTVYAVVNESRAPIELFNHARIIAHRGSSLAAPENTIAAFEQALDDKADGIEFDIRVTRDGVAIVMHDTTLGRTTNITGNPNVSTTPYSTIEGLDAGSWFSDAFIGEPIPTLEEALLYINTQSDLYIELKETVPGLEEYVVALLEENDLVDNAKILSFDQEQLARIKALNEDIETVFLIVTFYGNINALIAYEHIDIFAFESSIIINNPNYSYRLQEAGKFVYVWTVNAESRLREVVDIGVDGIITDDPVLAREIAQLKNTRTFFREIMRNLFN